MLGWSPRTTHSSSRTWWVCAVLGPWVIESWVMPFRNEKQNLSILFFCHYIKNKKWAVVMGCAELSCMPWGRGPWVWGECVCPQVSTCLHSRAIGGTAGDEGGRGRTEAVLGCSGPWVSWEGLWVLGVHGVRVARSASSKNTTNAPRSPLAAAPPPPHHLARSTTMMGKSATSDFS